MISGFKSSKKIIELVGPPGVGKSTIYYSLCKAWTRNSNWIYEDMLLAPEKPGISNTSKWLEYNYRMIRGKKLSKSIPVEYGLRFINKNKSLASFLWDHLSDASYPIENEIDARFRASYFLFWNFCRYQAIGESTQDKPCIMEEGFLQKSFLIHDEGEHSLLLEKFLDRYLALIPLPHAVIHINMKHANLIIDRIRQRKKLLASHIGMDEKALLAETEKWQHLLNLMLKKLQSKGVKVFNLDGAMTIAQNVAIIRQFLKEI